MSSVRHGNHGLQLGLDTVEDDAYTRIYMPDPTYMARRMATECPGFRLRQASRVLTKFYDDALRPLGLQMSQLPVLAALAAFGESGASMKALADAIVMDPTTVSRNIRPLEKAGFLRVARSPHDGRSRVVLLTRAGERALRAAFPVWESALERIREALGDGPLADLLRRLDGVMTIRDAS